MLHFRIALIMNWGTSVLRCSINLRKVASSMPEINCQIGLLRKGNKQREVIFKNNCAGLIGLIFPSSTSSATCFKKVPVCGGCCPNILCRKRSGCLFASSIKKRGKNGFCKTFSIYAPQNFSIFSNKG